MSALADSIPIVAMTEAADRRRRIIAIVGASSGNLVEWYDFYAYAFTSIYFASAFVPERRCDQPAASDSGHFRRGLLHAPSWGVAIRLDRGHAWPSDLDDHLGAHDVRRFADDCDYADFRNHWWVGASAPSHRPTDAGAFGWR